MADEPIVSERSRNGDTHAYVIHSQSAREAAIDDAVLNLELGSTTKQIADKHHIPERTLRAWLLVDERANPARARFIAGKLAESVDEIESAEDTLPLARAREKFRAWSWLAERRLPQIFGQQQAGNGASVTINIGVRRNNDTKDYGVTIEPE
jgi:hypothetical protein